MGESAPRVCLPSERKRIETSGFLLATVYAIVCRCRSVADGLLAELDRRRDRVADRGSAVGLHEAERVEGALDEVAIRRRRRRDLRLAREGDQPDLHALRHALEECLHRGLRRAEPRRLDVGRVHRAGHVDDEDHGRLVRRDERRAVRPRERDAEEPERDEEQRGRDVAAHRACLGDRREHVQVRERDRVPCAPALDEQVGEHEQRQQEQRQEQKRMPEAHLPPAHTA